MLSQYSVEDAEGCKVEEDVDNVGGEFNALLPLFPQDTGQGQEQRLCRGRGRQRGTLGLAHDVCKAWNSRRQTHYYNTKTHSSYSY